MTKRFESAVCSMFSTDLVGVGYQAQGCSFVRRKEGLHGTIWLVEGGASLKDHFMPRLSVGIDAIGPDIAVLSRDLHQLVNSSAPTRWYSWKNGAGDVDEAKEALLNRGLPWLDHHLSLPGLIQALEQKREPPREIPKRAWWPLGTGGPIRRHPVDLNTLQALSFAYELQGRYESALDAWKSYIEGHSRLQMGSTLERELTERLRSLIGTQRNLP